MTVGCGCKFEPALLLMSRFFSENQWPIRDAYLRLEAPQLSFLSVADAHVEHGSQWPSLLALVI